MNELTSLPSCSRRMPIAVALALATTLAGTARAETSPYTLGASETFTHDSNVRRLANDQATPAGVQSRADWIATTTLFGAIDQPIERQRLYGNLSVRDNRFRHNDDYNNLGYGLSTGVDWETVERVSGNVYLRANRNLASAESNTTNTPIVVKNVEQTRQFGATARVGVVTDYTFEGGLSRQTQNYSAVGNRLTQNVYTLGTRYRSGGELSFGAGVRFTHGRYPDVDDSFKSRNIDLTTNWAPDDVSNVDARVSFGKTDHTNASGNDFSGVTGSLAWKWRPGGRTVLDTLVSRETGNNSSFTTVNTVFGPQSAQGDISRVTNTLSLNATYEASAKILLNAGYTYQKRDLTNALSGNVLLAGSTSDGDRLKRLQFGARWVPTRTLEFACNLGRDSRSADNGTLTYSYRANTFACSGQVAINP